MGRAGLVRLVRPAEKGWQGWGNEADVALWAAIVDIMELPVGRARPASKAQKGGAQMWGRAPGGGGARPSLNVPGKEGRRGCLRSSPCVHSIVCAEFAL